MGGASSVVAAVVKPFTPVLKAVGSIVSTVLDPITGADEAKRKQQEALDEMKRQQAAQEAARLAEEKRRAEAAPLAQEQKPVMAEPTPPGATATPAEETALARRKRLNTLRMGISSTIRTSTQGDLGAAPSVTAATAKAKLGQ